MKDFFYDHDNSWGIKSTLAKEKALVAHEDKRVEAKIQARKAAIAVIEAEITAAEIADALETEINEAKVVDVVELLVSRSPRTKAFYSKAYVYKSTMDEEELEAQIRTQEDETAVIDTEIADALETEIEEETGVDEVEHSIPKGPETETKDPCPISYDYTYDYNRDR